LAGIRVHGQKLVGRLDDARSAIIRQERSKHDIAVALAQHGFIELKIGNLTINAASVAPQPELSTSLQTDTPQETNSPPPVGNAVHDTPEMMPKKSQDLAPAQAALPKQNVPSQEPARISSPPPKPQKSDPINGKTELPKLGDEAKGLLALWTGIFPSLPDQLKGRLVPFAPIAIEENTLVLGSESEGLVEAVHEPLAGLIIDHEQIRSLRGRLVESSQVLNLRSMLRQLRADRDPVFREQLALREHETTQAVVNLFGAIVDEVGL